MVASGVVRKVLDLNREDPRARPLQGRRAVPDGAAAGRGGRRLRDAGLRRLGHALRELQDAAPAAAGAGRRPRQPDPGPARPRHGQDDVVTVMWGEFGRTPRIGDSTPDGRGHWPPVDVGRGSRRRPEDGTGHRHDQRSRRDPRTGATRVPQVLSTIYRAMGIDPAQTFPNGSGRPMYILDDREPVARVAVSFGDHPRRRRQVCLPPPALHLLRPQPIPNHLSDSPSLSSLAILKPIDAKPHARLHPLCGPQACRQ